jgi:hypothetical protein
MSTDTTILFVLSNISTACIVGTIALAALEIYKRQKKDEFAEAAADRVEADKTWQAITESREHFFAFAPQPQQQHAALTGAELPALSAQSHEDEQAANEDDDHTGWWQLLLATLIAAADEASRIVAVCLNGCRARALVLFAGYRKPKRRGRHWADGVNHTGHFSIIRRRGGEN